MKPNLLPPPIPDATMERICAELCDGVKGANPKHPRLRRDVEGALYLATNSPTLCTAVAEIATLRMRTVRP